MSSSDPNNPSGYTLSLTLTALDSSAIRSIAQLTTAPTPTLLLGSESGTITSYPLSTLTPTLHPISHPHSVTALVTLPSGDAYATGSKDSHVRLYDYNHELKGMLSGHTNAVTDLALAGDDDKGHFLLSGSWDGTCKIWSLSSLTLLTTLEGHENTVCVQFLPSEGSALRVLTGSVGINTGHSVSGYKLRVWDVDDKSGASRLIKTVEDHGAPIRSLASNRQFVASGSNDGVVIVRDFDISTIQRRLPACDMGTPPLILQIHTSLDRYCLAGTEDGQFLIWDTRTGTRSIINHPGCVWSVRGLANGDVATGCDDGKLRVFTLDQARFATEEERNELEKTSHELRRKREGGPSPSEIAKLDDWDERGAVQGTSDGMVKMFRKGGKAIAAQWSLSSRTWIEVGEVLGSRTAGSINGVDYDHVLPIELDMPDGSLKKMQIGYNNGENPFVVAQKFIDDNMLNQGYLAEIADYIRKRVGDEGVELEMGGGAAATPMDTTPFGTTVPSIQPKTVTYQNFPKKGYLSFESGADSKSLAKITSKTKDFHEVQCQMTCDVSYLDSLASTLAATSRYHSSSVANRELEGLFGLLEEWPTEKVFPVLDLLRLVVIHPDAARMDRKSYWDKVFKTTIHHLETLQDKTTVAIPMLSFRLFANSFRQSTSPLAAISPHIPTIITLIRNDYARHPNKNARLAIATTMLNMATYLHSSKDKQPTFDVLKLGLTLLNTSLYEVEATTRVLVAVGTCLLNKECAVLARDMDVWRMVMVLKGRYGDKADSVLDEIGSLLNGII